MRMVENDVYNNRGKYEWFLRFVPQLEIAPARRGHKRRCTYYCKNPVNIRYFRQLARKFDAQDLSYIRLNKIFSVLLFIVHHTEKNLSQLTAVDIERLSTVMFQSYITATRSGEFHSSCAAGMVAPVQGPDPMAGGQGHPGQE